MKSMQTEEIFIKFPCLKTQRLILRPLSFDDAKDVFTYSSRPEVTRYVLWNTHQTIHDTMDYIRSVNKRYLAREYIEWGIQLLDNSQIIGSIGFGEVNLVHNRVEMGYVLSKDYWNQGIMTEAVEEILRFSFEDLTINRIMARCHEENHASEKVMQKAGMLYEGTLRQVMYVKHDYWTMKVYAILRRDYPTSVR